MTSANLCLPHLLPLLSRHDAFLIACYSQHPLVDALREKLRSSGRDRSRKHVAGIFEASVALSLNLLSATPESFGIVSTGEAWKQGLEAAVHHLLGTSKTRRFAGCETSGLSALELHDTPETMVEQRMGAATRRLIQRAAAEGNEIRCICLGCAGMAGLEDVVLAACEAELGASAADNVHVVDGVKAAVGFLVTACLSGI